MKILHLIFPKKDFGCQESALLLAARVIFSALLATHGYQKLMAFSEMSARFPDPLGVGSELSLTLAIFGELVCAIAVIAGFLTRLALIPMIFTMAVAFFVAHSGSISEGELAFAYLVVFMLLLLAGPGKYSIDNIISNKIS